MGLLNPESLAETVDRIEDAYFTGTTPGKAARAEAARWIASRQGAERAYRGLFAPTAKDWERPLVLFTGEKVTTSAGRAHILGEEAGRALVTLGVQTRPVRAALEAAGRGFRPVLERTETWQVEQAGGFRGEFCCATCSAALWRHLTAGGLVEIGTERWLAAGMASLKGRRKGGGRWQRYPFHYTVLALAEIDLPGAVEELRYAAPVLERVARRRPKESDHRAARRRVLAERALARC